MLELLSVENFYNFAFYFGILILVIAVLFGAWRSTYVPGLQNITVVVLQHPSGRQTVERFTSTRRTSTTEEEVGLQDEVYEEITLTAEDDDADEDDETEDDSGVEIAILESSSPSQTHYNITNVSQNSSSDSGTLMAEEINSSAAMASNPTSSNSSAPHLPSTRLDSLIASTPIVSSLKDVLTTDSSHLPLNVSGESSSSIVNVEYSSLHSSSTVDELNSECAESADGMNLDAENIKCLENENNTLQTDQDHCAASLHIRVQEDDGVLPCTSVSASSASTFSPVEHEPSLKCKKHEDESNDPKQPSTESEVPEEQSCPPGSIRIRLKYLDERQKTVFGQLTQNLLVFKRNHFNSELAEHRVIRLIFNGRLLKPDSSTLQECGLFDNCVVHCHVSQPKPPPPPSQQPAGEDAAGGLAQQQTRRNRGGRRRWLHFLWHASVPDALHDDDAAEGLDLSNYMSALLWLVVAGLWFMRFKHSYMFSTFSTFMLIFLTMLLVVPHYIFSVDVQLSVNLDGNTMRNLGIDRVVVLERLRGRRENSARRGRVDDDGIVVRRRNSDQNESTGINSGLATSSRSTPSTSRDRNTQNSSGDTEGDALQPGSSVAVESASDSR